MTLREKLLLKFRKSKVVRIRIYHNDHRISEHYDIPTNQQISVSTGTYTITRDNYFIQGGIPTYTYAEDDTAPMDPIKLQEGKTDKAINAKEVKALIERQDIQNVMQTIKGGNENKMMMIVMFIMVVVIGVAFYFMYEEMQTLQNEIGRLTDYYFGGERP